MIGIVQFSKSLVRVRVSAGDEPDDLTIVHAEFIEHNHHGQDVILSLNAWNTVTAAVKHADTDGKGYRVRWTPEQEKAKVEQAKAMCASMP